MEIITLRYRSVEQVLPILRPLVEPGGALTGMQDQLVVRASAANIAELRKVLESIDRMPRRLLISVRQNADAGSASRSASVSGTIGSGNVVISNQPGGASNDRNPERNIAGRINDSRSTGSDGVTQTIQVLEGNPAMIQTGESVPVPNRVVTRTVNGVVVTDTVAYRDIGSGFQVIPRLSGDRVMLEIASSRDTPVGSSASGGLPGSANIQRTATTVSARLGEWVELGGMEGSESRTSGGLFGSANSQRSESRRIQVKVEEIK
jgi:type II secretory pathway component GspD/PulD (secretin)